MAGESIVDGMVRLYVSETRPEHANHLDRWTSKQFLNQPTKFPYFEKCNRRTGWQKGHYPDSVTHILISAERCQPQLYIEYQSCGQYEIKSQPI